jgi:hypothetical protein
VFTRTLDAAVAGAFFSAMDAETWLEKAARLQEMLVPIDRSEYEADLVRDRIKIALWLRREFDANHAGSNVVPFALYAGDE